MQFLQSRAHERNLQCQSVSKICNGVEHSKHLKCPELEYLLKGPSGWHGVNLLIRPDFICESCI